jgi:hypothetical protein
MDNPGLDLIAVHEVAYNDELYKLIDFLNKALKDKNLIFGLAMKDDDRMTVSIYEA